MADNGASEAASGSNQNRGRTPTSTSMEVSIDSNMHPLFIHNNDHPGLILISTKLTGSDNYSDWSRCLQISLSAKNKSALIDGSFPIPEKDLFPLWARANDMVISWIFNVISEEISNSLRFVSSAFVVWGELKERYSNIDGHRVFQLEKDIHRLEQRDGSVEAYYHKMKCLWDESLAIETITACSCNNCVCGSIKTQETREQRKKLMQFLMGLHDSFANIRVQILRMKPLPTVGEAYYMIRQEESLRVGYIPDKGIICNYCNKEGHTKGECYRLHGPAGHPKEMQVSQNKAGEVKHNEAEIDLLKSQLGQVLAMLKGNKHPEEHLAATKILQHLDKMSPRDVPTVEKSPTKLTSNMLHGQALRSIDTLDSSKFLSNAQEGHKSEDLRKTCLPDVHDSTSQNDSDSTSQKDQVEENGSKMFAVPRNLLAPVNSDATVSGRDTSVSVKTADSFLKVATELPQKKHAFQMSAHEDFLEMDDEIHSNGVASTPLVEKNEKLETSATVSKTSSSEAVSLSTLGSSAPSTGFSFGVSSTSAATTSSSPAMVFGSSATGASSGPSMFKFGSSAATTSSFPSFSQMQPVFGNSPPVFAGPSGNNDQMDMDDSMAEDTLNSPAPAVPAFGQPLSQGFMLGSAGPAPTSALPGNPFQFGGQPNSANPSPFQASSSVEFNAGGSFSLGSGGGGGDKSGRRMVRVSKNKNRKK